MVRGILEEYLQQENSTLLTSNELEEILRAQGSIRALNRIFDKIETVVEAAVEEEKDG